MRWWAWDILAGAFISCGLKASTSQPMLAALNFTFAAVLVVYAHQQKKRQQQALQH